MKHTLLVVVILAILASVKASQSGAHDTSSLSVVVLAAKQQILDPMRIVLDITSYPPVFNPKTNIGPHKHNILTTKPPTTVVGSYTVLSCQIDCRSIFTVRKNSRIPIYSLCATRYYSYGRLDGRCLTPGTVNLVEATLAIQLCAVFNGCLPNILFPLSLPITTPFFATAEGSNSPLSGHL